jgi:hypothetical protein
MNIEALIQFYTAKVDSLRAAYGRAITKLRKGDRKSRAVLFVTGLQLERAETNLARLRSELTAQQITRLVFGA